MEGTPVIPAVAPEQVEALRQSLDGLFAVSDTTMDQPQRGYVRFRGRFLQDAAERFDDLRRRFETHGFTPLVRQDEDRTALIAMPVVFSPSASNWLVNLVLFVLTVLSTLFVGASYGAETAEQAWQLWRGWPFSLSILLILGAHELGHYFAARHHQVPVTLPYFIPMPFSIIGTMGAFIRLKAPVKNRRALLDVGAAGPLAGLVFTIPILLYGLATSQIVPLTPGGFFEGNSILYALAKFLVFGRILPGGGEDVLLNQVAWAGWVGLLVTGLNLIPVGQLDGGHVAYVLFGDRARLFFWPVIGALAAISLYSYLQGAPASTWLIWIVLLFLLGRNYARPLDDVTPLDPTRRIIAIFTLLLFFLVFVPIPLTTVVP
jgi:membrane-associated protease RseP (regulator of RpoE activity)